MSGDLKYLEYLKEFLDRFFSIFLLKMEIYCWKRFLKSKYTNQWDFFANG